MSRPWLKRTALFLGAGLILAGGAWFGWPRPIPVDLATVTTAPMTVTVDEEAKTRVRHVYTVSAPVAGKVLRTPYHVGDPVVADETVVATMEPARPSFHDVRTHEELQNVVAAADAAVRFAEAEVRRAHGGRAGVRAQRASTGPGAGPDRGDRGQSRGP